MYPEEMRVKMREPDAVRMSNRLQHLDDVIDVVEANNGVINRADDLHRVTFENLAAAQFSTRLDVLELSKHVFDFQIRFEESSIMTVKTQSNTR
jgi:uncharacterized protein with PhoU and TrkA domain